MRRKYTVMRHIFALFRLQSEKKCAKLSGMEMWKIDKNFAPGRVLADGSVTRYAIPCAPFDLYGVYYDDAERRFVRLPADVAAATKGGVCFCGLGRCVIFVGN